MADPFAGFKQVGGKQTSTGPDPFAGFTQTGGPGASAVTPTRPIQTSPSAKKSPFITKDFAGGGFNLVNPQAAGQLASATSGASTTASELAKRSAESKDWNSFLSELMIDDKPYDVQFEDVIRASKVSPESAKKWVDLKNSFSGQAAGFEKSAQAVRGIINELNNVSDKIPASTGFTGRQLQGPLNSVQEFVGYLPEKTAHDAFVGLALPLLRKAFGDTGNVGEKEQALVLPALELMAHPQKESRELGRKMFENIYNTAFKTRDGLTKQKSSPPFTNKSATPTEGLTPEEQEELKKLTEQGY